MSNVESAFASVELEPSSVVLLGIQPEKAETSYGWIEPAQSLFGGLARSVSKVETFLDMFREHLPALLRMFAASSRSFGAAEEKAVVSSLYAWIHETNFSTEVLERSAANLLVMRVSDVTWSDLGEPQRVLGMLTNLGVHTEWMQALAA